MLKQHTPPGHPESIDKQQSSKTPANKICIQAPKPLDEGRALELINLRDDIESQIHSLYTHSSNIFVIERDCYTHTFVFDTALDIPTISKKRMDIIPFLADSQKRDQ